MKTVLKTWLALWLLTAVAGTWLLQACGLQLNASGHGHVFAHGHHFADARAWGELPNALDVLSNLPFVGLGLYGLLVLRGKTLASNPRAAAQVFFAGLLLTGLLSSLYHLQPNATLGLALDRAGMAAAFAGVVGLALHERTSLEQVQTVMWSVLVLGVLSAFLPHFTGQVLPWGVVQFGGVALVLACACRRPVHRALGVNLLALIAWYIAAKLFEQSDAAVFEATQHLVSGHSLKHLAASLAALPVLSAIKRSTSTTL